VERKKNSRVIHNDYDIKPEPAQPAELDEITGTSNVGEELRNGDGLPAVLRTHRRIDDK